MSEHKRVKDSDQMLRELLDSYDESAYPERFLKEYTITECLAE